MGNEWILRMGAAVLAELITKLFNRALNESFVPKQWKSANITPVAKVAQPREPVDYRPVSITSVLSRMYEKMLVKDFVYP